MDSNASVVNAAVQTENNGYRLPTGNEWEMAARWKHDTGSLGGSILVGDRYWTPGNYPSGSSLRYTNDQTNSLVAWYLFNTQRTKHRQSDEIAEPSGHIRHERQCLGMDVTKSGSIPVGFMAARYSSPNSRMQVGEEVTGYTHHASIGGFRMTEQFPFD